MSEDQSADNRLREIQHQIRQNAFDTSSYLSELQQWENDIRQKDAELLLANSSGLSPATSSHPVRKTSKGISYGSQKAETKKVTEKKASENITQPSTNPNRIKSSDYAAWDKFDVDKACDDMDYRTASDDEKTTTNPKMVKNTPEENDTKKDTVHDVKRAEFEKSLGNDLFEKGQFSEAVAHYARAMELDEKNPIYPANRAMASIKLKNYSAAESDCSAALSLDPSYVKAYHRRATARLSLKNYHGAKDDFNRVLSLDPNNKDAKEKLKIITEWEAKHVKPLPAKAPLPSAPPLSTTKLSDWEMRPVSQTKLPETSARKDGKVRIYPVEKSPLEISKKPLRKVPVTDADSVTEPVKSASAAAPEENHTKIQPAQLSPATPVLVQPVAIAKKASVSGREFIQSCATLSRNASAAADYIQAVDPACYAKLIGHNLEEDIFGTIFLGSLALARRSHLRESFAHLVGLASVPRVSFFVYCIADVDKKEFGRYFSMMAVQGLEQSEVIQQIAKKYLIDFV